jgi:hypothetical protein
MPRTAAINRVGRELEQARQNMKARPRVYLFGHGDWRQREIGDWDPETVASWVKLLNPPNDTVVSILGCQLGRDPD